KISPLPSIKSPFSTFHLAAPPFSSRHSDASSPLKSTTASDGGFPGDSCVLKSPGVTTSGCGRLGSCTCQGVPGTMGVLVNPSVLTIGDAGGLACAQTEPADRQIARSDTID